MGCFKPAKTDTPNVSISFYYYYYWYYYYSSHWGTKFCFLRHPAAKFSFGNRKTITMVELNLIFNLVEIYKLLMTTDRLFYKAFQATIYALIGCSNY